MAFTPKLPTFNLDATISRFNGLIWVPDLLTVKCQLYAPLRNAQLVWLSWWAQSRGDIANSFGDYQTSFYLVYFLLPKLTVVRNPFDIPLNALGGQMHDFVTVTVPDYGVSEYWIDQVIPRWSGFPNQHLLVVTSLKGRNPA